RGYLTNVAPQNWSKIVVPGYAMPAPRIEVSKTTIQDAARKYIESVATSGDRLIGLGIPELDYAIGGGAESGEMFLLAARPSHGKSALAMQMVHHWTVNETPVVFV